jgi:hypothetical protein
MVGYQALLSYFSIRSLFLSCDYYDSHIVRHQVDHNSKHLDHYDDAMYGDKLQFY